MFPVRNLELPLVCVSFMWIALKSPLNCTHSLNLTAHNCLVGDKHTFSLRRSKINPIAGHIIINFQEPQYYLK